MSPEVIFRFPWTAWLLCDCLDIPLQIILSGEILNCGWRFQSLYFMKEEYDAIRSWVTCDEKREGLEERNDTISKYGSPLQNGTWGWPCDPFCFLGRVSFKSHSVDTYQVALLYEGINVRMLCTVNSQGNGVFILTYKWTNFIILFCV